MTDVCKCAPGFSGHNCGLAADYCLMLKNEGMVTCQNDGQCVNTEEDGGGYNCECRTGFTGRECEVVVCASTFFCLHGGTCVPQRGGTYSCLCVLGFEGDVCEVDICASSPCQHSDICQLHDPDCTTGTCHGSEGQEKYLCTCQPGYAGSHCEEDFNECDSTPCQNSGECSEFVGRYSCDCLNGFTSADCETDVCKDTTPCHNGGTCLPDIGHGKVKCSCPLGFYGPNCEGNACAPNPCNYGGACEYTAVGAPVATCSDGQMAAATSCTVDCTNCNVGTTLSTLASCKT